MSWCDFTWHTDIHCSKVWTIQFNFETIFEKKTILKFKVLSNVKNTKLVSQHDVNYKTSQITTTHSIRFELGNHTCSYICSVSFVSVGGGTLCSSYGSQDCISMLSSNTLK